MKRFIQGLIVVSIPVLLVLAIAKELLARYPQLWGR